MGWCHLWEGLAPDGSLDTLTGPDLERATEISQLTGLQASVRLGAAIGRRHALSPTAAGYSTPLAANASFAVDVARNARNLVVAAGAGAAVMGAAA